MMDLLFGGSAGWFTAPALVGTIFFLIRLVAMSAGHGFEAGDVSHAVDVPGDVHADSDHAFKVLSIQSVAAFAMGFGWAGLASLKGAGWDISVCIAVATAGGLSLVWLLTILLKAVHDLQVSGNIQPQQAIGLVGEVYLTIPAARTGRGQVKLAIKNRLRVYDAVTDGSVLPTSSQIRVLAVEDDRTLTVASA